MAARPSATAAAVPPRWSSVLSNVASIGCNLLSTPSHHLYLNACSVACALSARAFAITLAPARLRRPPDPSRRSNFHFKLVTIWALRHENQNHECQKCDLGRALGAVLASPRVLPQPSSCVIMYTMAMSLLLVFLPLSACEEAPASSFRWCAACMHPRHPLSVGQPMAHPSVVPQFLSLCLVCQQPQTDPAGYRAGTPRLATPWFCSVASPSPSDLARLLGGAAPRS